jgi:hypothetical protein
MSLHCNPVQVEVQLACQVGYAAVCYNFAPTLTSSHDLIKILQPVSLLR